MQPGDFGNFIGGRSTVHEIRQFIKEYKGKIGEIIGTTPDFVVNQTEMDVFGAITQNMDPQHNDPAWGATSPWGSTIVHGMMMVSYIGKFWKEVGVPIYTTEKMYSMNYGLNKVRFPSVFLPNVPGRATIRLLDIQDKGDGRYLLLSECSVHQDGNEKPTMVAEFLVMIVTLDYE